LDISSVSTLRLTGCVLHLLLEWCLYQDIVAGRGCGLIDPHSLLVDDLLRLPITQKVPANPDIRHWLTYVDPARTDYVIPFNILATAAEHLLFRY